MIYVMRSIGVSNSRFEAARPFAAEDWPTWRRADRILAHGFATPRDARTPRREGYNEPVDPVYAMALLGLLGAGWIGVRLALRGKREREARRRRRKRRSLAKRDRGADTASPRSDMRATDSPVSVMDTLQKRAKKDKR